MGDDCMMQSLSYDVPRIHGPPTHAPQHPVTSKNDGEEPPSQDVLERTWTSCTLCLLVR